MRRAYHKQVKLKFYLPALLFSLLASGQAQDDPWKSADLLAPAKLATELKTSGQTRPIFYVGFPILYKGAHIQAAKFTGPCSKKEGLELLAEEVKGLPHDAEVIVYCGCCPFVRCPNIRPAYKALKDMGYTNIKVLELPTNLHSDWVEKGYPIETPGQ
jgi:rhodanese-related sulfurtransferase